MNNSKISEKEILENKIISITAKQLKKEKKLFAVGSGGSNIRGQEFLDLEFQYFSKLEIPEIRRLIVYSADLLLHNWNTYEKYQKYLEKPYEIKNIQIVIYLRNKDNSEIKPPGICIGDLVNNKINYKIYNVNYSLKTIYEETYEEAKKIIEEENIDKN